MRSIILIIPFLLFRLSDAVLSPFSFTFVCESDKCRKGAYQQVCPWAYQVAPSGNRRVGAASHSGGYLSAMCFDDRGMMSPPAILHNLQSCKKDVDFIDGKLVCTENPIHLSRPVKNINPGSRTFFNFQCLEDITNFGPSVRAYNCVNGAYRQKCPACSQRSDGTLVCWCFDENSQLHTSSFINTKKCSEITAKKGKLTCANKMPEY